MQNTAGSKEKHSNLFGWEFNLYGEEAETLECVRLLRLSVPSHKFVGERAVLKCIYDLEREQLYSVKWYKDGHEFFRFTPGDRDQQVTVFHPPGVKVIRSQSDDKQVALRGLKLESAGQYRCEISAEAPLFNTVSRSSRMAIVVLPRGSPRISNAKHTYHLGDIVRVNCTSERSKPAATLHWYINNRQAPNEFVRYYRPIQHEDGLETSIMGLEFEVNLSSFNKGKRPNMTLKCSSSVSTVNSEAQTTETHHQKSSSHFSYGSLTRSTGVRNLTSGVNFLVIIFFFWFWQQRNR